MTDSTIFYDYAIIKQKYLSELTFASNENLINLYPELGSMNDWLWRLRSGRFGAERVREHKVYQSEMKKAEALENYIHQKDKSDYEYIKNTFDNLAKLDQQGDANLIFSHLQRISTYQHWLKKDSAPEATKDYKRTSLLDAISLVSWLQLLDKRNLIKKDSPLYSFLEEARKENFSFFQKNIEAYYQKANSSKLPSMFAEAKAMQGRSSEKQFEESRDTWPVIQRWKREFLLSQDLPYYPSINKSNILGMALGVVKKTAYSPSLKTSFVSDLDLGFRNSKGAPTFNADGQLIGMYVTTDHVQSRYLNHFYDKDIAASYHFSAEDILANLEKFPSLKKLVQELK